MRYVPSTTGNLHKVYRNSVQVILKYDESLDILNIIMMILQISIDSIFPPSEDVGTCISNAADSVGLKELPRYEVEMREREDWIMKTQVGFCF